MSCNNAKPKECFTLPYKVFFVIYFNSGKGRLDLQGHGWLVRREVSTGGGKVTCDKNVKANYVTRIKVQFCHWKLTWPVVSCFSIKEMAENVRFALEKEEKLQEEVLLEDKDFIVDLVEVVSFLFWTVMDSNLNNILTCYVRFALLTTERVYTKYRNFFHVSMKRLCVLYFLHFSVKRLLQYNIVGLSNKSSFVHNCCECFIDEEDPRDTFLMCSNFHVRSRISLLLSRGKVRDYP